MKLFQCLEKYVIILESEEEGVFFPNMSVWFSWLRPLKMLGTISLVSKLPVAPSSDCAVSVCVFSTLWGYPALQPGLHSEARD